MSTNIKTIKNILIVGLALQCTQAFAAKVLQVKNDKVMIDLEGAEAEVDQTVVLISPENKKVALAKIEKTKNGKAIALITKGKSQGNETVSFPAAGKVNKSTDSTQAATPSESSSEGSTSTTAYKTQSKRYSGLLTILSNTMVTKQTDGTNTEDVSMKSSTFGISGAIDWPLLSYLTARGVVGYEPFKASGTSTYLSCNSLTSTNCTAEINYLTAGGYARFDLTKSRAQFWLGIGANMKFPLSKSTTALKQEDIKMTMTYGAALGMDFFINSKMFVPVSVEQQSFLKSDTVSASMLMVRAGFGQTF